MVIEIKMCRFDNVPWGFRLVGGSDFEIPLTVVKVTEGSIAEEAGLRVDDVIVRINDEPTSPMSHDEAHNVISHCGNVFYLGIQREDGDNERTNFFPIIGASEPRISRSRTPESLINSSIQNQMDNESEDQSQAIDEIIESVLAEERESKTEDEEIASLLSTEAEMLKEQNVVGIFPKPGVCQSSEVLRELNEWAAKTKDEKIKEDKKWTTFMQKPNRPIPKSKQQLEAEARAANAYKIKIVKNYKKPEPVRPPTPIPVPEQEEPAKEPTPPPEIEEEPPTDSEVPNLEPAGEQTVTEENEEAATEVIEEVKNENENISEKEEPAEKEERDIESVDREAKAPSESGSVREKTEEELQLEQQLADVQKQLLALANLPSAIQSTLDAVTRQLSELLPTFKMQSKIVKEATPEIKEAPKQEEEKEETKVIELEESVESIKKEVHEESEKAVEIVTSEITQTITEETVKIETETKQEIKSQEVHVSERNIEEEQMEEEQNLKRKKENGVIEELQKELERKESQKRKKSKRMFFPLVPQERPLVLPGGRRWYRPKDAYNDEFIAETLTAQAELIAGTAVGLLFGTDASMKEDKNSSGITIVLLQPGTSKMVNFMKYQKPEKKVDLDKSEVYKVLHHLDKSPIRGIEVRPPVVVAEADVRKVVK